MDISETLAPASEQLDAVELVHPRTFLIERVSKGNAEQPVQIHFADFPRPWRPGKSMRRVLAHCWGVDASVYVGRKVTLFCDPSVVFGGQAVGGTRISHLSHIDGPKKVPLLISRGKSAMFKVEPLRDEPAAPSKATRDQLNRMAAAFDTIGITDRDERLEYVAGIIGRTANATELTSDEADTVISKLAEIAEPDEGSDLFAGGE